MSLTRQSILFINGLDKKVNENMLYQLFNEYSVSYIKIAKDILLENHLDMPSLASKIKSKPNKPSKI